MFFYCSQTGLFESYWNNDGTVKAVPGTSTSTPVLTTILKECWNRWVKHDNASFVAYPDSASYGSMAATVSGWIDDNSKTEKVFSVEFGVFFCFFLSCLIL